MNIIQINTLTGLISKGEKNKAKNFINDILSSIPHDGYAHALIAVLLCQTRKKLCEERAEFYLDEKELWEALFPKDGECNIAAVIDRMCEEVKNSARENRKRIFLKAIAYIDENLSDSNLSVGDAARYAGVSPGRLSKIFEAYKGDSPVEYIGRRRVEASMPKIKQRNASVGEIAISVGFSSAESYIRAFKKYHSISPGRWNKLFLSQNGNS